MYVVFFISYFCFNAPSRFVRVILEAAWRRTLGVRPVRTASEPQMLRNRFDHERTQAPQLGRYQRPASLRTSSASAKGRYKRPVSLSMQEGGAKNALCRWARQCKKRDLSRGAPKATGVAEHGEFVSFIALSSSRACRPGSAAVAPTGSSGRVQFRRPCVWHCQLMVAQTERDETVLIFCCGGPKACCTFRAARIEHVFVGQLKKHVMKGGSNFHLQPPPRATQALGHLDKDLTEDPNAGVRSNATPQQACPCLRHSLHQDDVPDGKLLRPEDDATGDGNFKGTQ